MDDEILTKKKKHPSSPSSMIAAKDPSSSSTPVVAATAAPPAVVRKQKKRRLNKITTTTKANKNDDGSSKNNTIVVEQPGEGKESPPKNNNENNDDPKTNETTKTMTTAAAAVPKTAAASSSSNAAIRNPIKEYENVDDTFGEEEEEDEEEEEGPFLKYEVTIQGEGGGKDNRHLGGASMVVFSASARKGRTMMMLDGGPDNAPVKFWSVLAPENGSWFVFNLTTIKTLDVSVAGNFVGGIDRDGNFKAAWASFSGKNGYDPTTKSALAIVDPRIRGKAIYPGSNKRVPSVNFIAYFGPFHSREDYEEFYDHTNELNKLSGLPLPLQTLFAYRNGQINRMKIVSVSIHQSLIKGTMSLLERKYSVDTNRTEPPLFDESNKSDEGYDDDDYTNNSKGNTTPTQEQQLSFKTPRGNMKLDDALNTVKFLERILKCEVLIGGGGEEGGGQKQQHVVAFTATASIGMMETYVGDGPESFVGTNSTVPYKFWTVQTKKERCSVAFNFNHDTLRKLSVKVGGKIFGTMRSISYARVWVKTSEYDPNNQMVMIQFDPRFSSIIRTAIPAAAAADAEEEESIDGEVECIPAVFLRASIGPIKSKEEISQLVEVSNNHGHHRHQEFFQQPTTFEDLFLWRNGQIKTMQIYGMSIHQEAIQKTMYWLKRIGVDTDRTESSEAKEEGNENEMEEESVNSINVDGNDIDE